MTKIELENRVPLYKSGDMKLGEIVTETVKDVREQDFRSDPEDEPNKKWVLIFESGKGLALSYSNVVFLIEHSIKEYESLIGMHVVFAKEARSITAGDGKKHDVVGLFIKELH